eukprot:TRINITY_DN10766_c0_g3_i1.p2 TRINITY_DN10766_c0_g3~~TRINITY_DN10766_c0_g3_i1.p2  ORF type:complete len:261 (+),score=82.72 TRINITY_DN10766_c0_g3_i1:743-1525(+)
MGSSRWLNYYVEGLAWSVARAPHIDGLYFDGINFSYKSMRRVRRTLDAAHASRGDAAPHIDIHTGNEGAGAPPAVQYGPYYPHADTLWNGEGFHFDYDEAYWFAEVSGVPYGVPVDRLGGAPTDNYRGMLYASTQRNSAVAPALWALWDAAGMAAATMIGYWEPAEDRPFTLAAGTPATAQDFKATTYLQYGRSAVVVVASWHAGDYDVVLTANATVLGFRPASATVPAVAGLQAAATIADITAPIKIPARAGVILTVHA